MTSLADDGNAGRQEEVALYEGDAKEWQKML